MKYKIRHEETSVDYFTVEANSEREALEEFSRQVEEGLIDYSNMEMISSTDTIED